MNWTRDGTGREHGEARALLEVGRIFHEPSEVNLGWHPKAEDLPNLQEKKVSQNGAANVRYARGKKGKMVKIFKHMLGEHLPYGTIRYAF